MVARDMGVHRLLWYIYNELNLLGVFGAMDRGAERKENLIALSQHAEKFESGGYRGLFSFCLYKANQGIFHKKKNNNYLIKIHNNICRGEV